MKKLLVKRLEKKARLLERNAKIFEEEDNFMS